MTLARSYSLVRSVTMAQQAPSPIDNAETQSLREEVEAQTALTAKAKRALRLAESEISCLRAELRQSSNKETHIRAKGRWAIKDLEDKLTAESASHARTKELNSKLSRFELLT